MLDRRGVLLPIELALAAGAVVSVGLALGLRPLAYVPLIVAAGGAYGVLFTPAFALIADGAERTGLPQGMAFGLMNAAWATGALDRPRRRRGSRGDVRRRRPVPRLRGPMRDGAGRGAARATPPASSRPRQPGLQSGAKGA